MGRLIRNLDFSLVNAVSSSWSSRLVVDDDGLGKDLPSHPLSFAALPFIYLGRTSADFHTTGTMNYLMFCGTAAASIWSKKATAAETSSSCADLKNSAFVFVKPHANTEATQKMVRETLEAKGIEILSESDISGKTIDEKKLIDQHYYAIASKATILSADKIPVPETKFEETFGEKWSDVLKEGRAANAMQACEKFGCDAEELDAAW